jgi:hypothetical protein
MPWVRAPHLAPSEGARIRARRSNSRLSKRPRAASLSRVTALQAGGRAVDGRARKPGVVAPSATAKGRRGQLTGGRCRSLTRRWRRHMRCRDRGTALDSVPPGSRAHRPCRIRSARLRPGRTQGRPSHSFREQRSIGRGSSSHRHHTRCPSSISGRGTALLAGAATGLAATKLTNQVGFAARGGGEVEVTRYDYSQPRTVIFLPSGTSRICSWR